MTRCWASASRHWDASHTCGGRNGYSHGNFRYTLCESNISQSTEGGFIFPDQELSAWSHGVRAHTGAVCELCTNVRHHSSLTLPSIGSSLRERCGPGCRQRLYSCTGTERHTHKLILSAQRLATVRCSAPSTSQRLARVRRSAPSASPMAGLVSYYGLGLSTFVQFGSEKWPKMGQNQVGMDCKVVRQRLISYLLSDLRIFNHLQPF